MLTPEYLEDLPEEILQLFYEAEQEIIADMARRVSTYDYWIPAAEYQRQKLRVAGVLQEDILKSLSGITGRSEAELKRLMQEAGTKSLQSDTAVYEAAGMTVPKIADSAPLREILNAGYKATAQTMRNICKTTARTATMQFENALDLAWMKVHSGAFDTDSAVRAAIKELSERGIQSIRYPSGRTDSIEVAVRRAVVTGVNQTAGQLQEELADELGCDLVEVSAHAGARPEHAKWQGKIYSRSGNDPKYPDFKKSTGYGTGAGLCGWNCRHTFGPYIEGSPPVWSEEQLAELNAPKYEYGGRKLTEYEASQQQRYNERQIRRWKREEAAMRAAGLDSSEAAAKVKEWQGRQQEFLAQTGFKRQYGREAIANAGAIQNGDENTTYVVSKKWKNAQAKPLPKHESSSSPEATATYQIKNTPEDVLSEYTNNATPGVGEIIFEEGYKVSGHQAEIDTAHWLHDTFGGDITLLCESNTKNEKSPDYVWRGAYWELKGASSVNSADKQAQHAIKQIQSNPGGVIIELSTDDITEDIVAQVTRRVQRSNIGKLDIMIVKDKKALKILRYKK